MKINKNLMQFAVIFSVLLALVIATPAQRRKRKKPPPKPKVIVTDSATKKNEEKTDKKTGAEKVSIQIKNVSKFLYTLGGVAKGIEDIDKAIKEGKASPEVAQKNREFKRQVIQSIRNLRAGLIALEAEFRTNNELKPYLFQIQGISNISGTAEDQALGGQFNESGRTLLFVVEKLADTLAEMP